MTSLCVLIIVFLSALCSTLTAVWAKSVVRHLESHSNHRLRYEDNDIDADASREDQLKALMHNNRVTMAATCELPKPQVVHVSDHYSDPTMYYLPHCTLLHRCGKHSGCCATKSLRCVAAEKEKVELYFFSVRVVGPGIPAKSTIEKLVFTNHTRCGCVFNERLNKFDL